MLQNLDLTKILILDIETVPQYPSFDEVPDKWQHLWTKKSATLRKADGESESDVYPRAGIYAEFGKIVCISCGFFSSSGRSYQFRVKSFYGNDEVKLLSDFNYMLERHFSDPGNSLCAHNGKEFDYPYIARRCLLNGLEIPSLLDIAGKKPWEISLLDTMELWKFGDYKSYTSLELLAASFGIPTPKDDIDGSMVWKVYWQEQDVERIMTYCQKDVVTVAQLLLKFRNESLLNDEQILFV
ncbi:MAG: 3'-5' exonuclease [Bacteroidetes bacterium B1(2017)]|nr:MAG: 3'-5' exonuclease [Bacteroidetes bacterium B1(2017)]